jgi:ABC-type spermidine/putrescine transport system permease subunit II
LKSSELLANSQSYINHYEPVNTLSIFWNSLWRSTFVGGAIVTLCAAIYSTAVYPIAGTTAGLFIGAAIGFPTGFINGLIIAIITRLHYYPLKNFHYFRQEIGLISTICSFFITIIGFIWFSSFRHLWSNNLLLFWMIAPAIITGLSMGVVSKYFSRWYEQNSGVRK